MKNLIKAGIATGIIALAFGTFNPIYAHAQQEVYKTYSFNNKKLLPIKRIKVVGNIEVTLIQDKNTKTHFSNEGEQAVKFSQSGDQLLISPIDSKNLAKVKVYIDDIYRIEGCDGARIKSDGSLNMENLQIMLQHNAMADIQSTTKSMYTVCKDSSQLTLHGDSGELIVENSKLSSLVLNNFRAATTQIMPENQLAIR